MNMLPFTLGSARLQAMGSGAVHWPDQDLLLVSDLHLGKSERMARRGGALLPPYETWDSLTRLEADLRATGARRVICLGDSFDDAEAALAEAELAWLARLIDGRDWTWIAGNHDPVPMAVGGTHLEELQIGALALRHIANGEGHELSGHYHPKARLAGVTRPCFLVDQRHAILPAYGTYTGGLWCHDAVLADQMGDGACVILTGPRPIAVPLHRTARRA
ncbi:ligase-associated DNA damage response endonuclease PdeM [Falsirhodobacter sp. 20TX0035]|uniref:ligase-associated DNA damage response endonuclease PdeM n=1 Tax=Falsirhodobacter sp. 20TX0035 TaxID=3022019 RepID=UPI00232BACAA|nr:ligase-associated DNA damage response endonuclease PdeM [Falsirhodobacter sp. 20TX0035]MDB6453877.1 ligase-associated DNA damage response endonuclease PdeM [Falsirhodobacter sp. 20TX0035]